jgi:hypothetical protein
MEEQERAASMAISDDEGDIDRLLDMSLDLGLLQRFSL